MAHSARLLSSRNHVVPGQLLVSELFFEVPLDYSDVDGEQLILFGRAVTKFEKPIIPRFPQWADNISHQDFLQIFHRPWLLYLEGGPGAGCREPQDNNFTRFAISRGYQVLFLDYRGTGYSTPVNAAALKKHGDAQAQADYLKHFRADTIARDCEAVRHALTFTLSEEKRQWSILGQSFGGFVALTYLSFHSRGLREVFMTGGLAPLDKPAEEVYRRTFPRVMERNRIYFEKFPEDAETLHQIALFLKSQEGYAVQLPSGGRLTLGRIYALGQAFGFHGGLDSVHALILKMKADLMQFGTLVRSTLVAVDSFLNLDVCPIYTLLHEPLYCYKKGIASRWAAEMLGKEFDRFNWLQEGSPPIDYSKYPLYFSGEMIFPFMFDTFPELMELKEVANILAEYDDWPELYDERELQMNVVPVYAASYIDDIYVDLELAQETARKVKGIKVYETNGLYHNAIRSRSEEVLSQLFRLRDDSID